MNPVLEAQAAQATQPEVRRLPRRDYILLPLLSLSTVIFLLAASEFTARALFPVYDQDPCETDVAGVGHRLSPNCTSHTKIAEAAPIEYRYNNCGYRSLAPCGPKPPGTIRIVFLGSSTTEGMASPYEQTMAVQSAGDLSKALHRPVEVQNLGVVHCGPLCDYRRVDEVIALKPDLVILGLSPLDLEPLIDAKSLADRDKPLPPPAPRKPVAPPGPLDRAVYAVAGSRTMRVVEHYLFQDLPTYIRMFLVYGDKADYLRRPLSPAWQKRLSDFDLLAGEMADRFHSAHIPFALSEVPSRAQASLASFKPLPLRVDPFVFDKAVSKIATKHGITYIEVVDEFRSVERPDRLYYPVDGHLTGEGQTFVGHAMARRLQSQNIFSTQQ